MRRIQVESIPLNQALPRPLFHESGHVVLREGDRVGAPEIDRLLLNGIRRLYDLGDGPPGREPDLPDPSALPPGGPPPEVESFLRDRRAARAWREIERMLPSGVPDDRLVEQPKTELRNGALAQVVERGRAGEEPDGPGLVERIGGARPYPPRPESDKREALEARRAAAVGLGRVFAELRAGQGARHEEVARLARAHFASVVRDPDLALAMRLDRSVAAEPRERAAGATQPPADRAADASDAPAATSGLGSEAEVDAELEVGAESELDLALARHSLNVATLAVATGIELGFGLSQLLELCYAALLHDVGMLRVPSALVDQQRELDPSERAEVERHPLHALTVLRRFDRLPLSVASVVYCEHERPDGSGYPNGTQGPEPVGTFARIVSVCDVFEALGADRPHRRALGPHHAVREVVALASKRRLDATALRGMLKAVSYFPIGSHVGLSDGRRGRVVRASVDANRPMVALYDEQGGLGARSALVDLSEARELRVTETDLAAPAGLDLLAGF